jgi:hypothetical protein
MTFRQTRTAALTTLALAGIVAASEAGAYSRVTYALAYGNTAPQLLHETTTSLRVEGKDNAGNLVGSLHCPIASNCPSSIAGAVNNVVVLEYDANREQLLSEKCRGIVSTLPQGRCENGDLEVVLRVRQGALFVKTVAESRDGPLLDTTSGPDVRFEFVEDPTRYWSPTGFWYDSTIKGYRFPAGNYKVFAPALGRYCKPVQANPGVRFDLPPDGSATVQIVYRGTECTVQIAADIDVGLTMSSDQGPITCQKMGQAGVATTKSICTGVFPFGLPVRITAAVPSGAQPYFGWVNNTCEHLPDIRTECNFTPTLDLLAATFTNIRMSTQAASAPPPPPPPPPVALTLAAGASAPPDRAAAKGAVGEVMLALRASAANGVAMLSSISVQASGSGRDDLDLVDVRVVLDANGDGIADAGETVLGNGRLTADNGILRLDFTSPLAVTGSADLLVVADIATQITSASAGLLGGAGIVLAIGVLAWPAGRRRAGPVLGAIALAVTMAAGCGGGEPAEPAVEAVPVDPAPAGPPVLLTYRLDLVAAEATDTATPANVLNVPSLPVRGAIVTVAK